MDLLDSSPNLIEDVIQPAEATIVNTANPDFDPIPVAESKEIIETAASTLDALGEDLSLVSKDSSAPSSLDSQAEAPASVIVETQEVPTPDSAAFIVKTDEQPVFGETPQEPVVEVIGESVIDPRNTIVEEEMSSPAFAAPAAADAPFEGMEPAKSSTSDMFEDSATSVEVKLNSEPAVAFNEPDLSAQANDFVLKTTSENEDKAGDLLGDFSAPQETSNGVHHDASDLLSPEKGIPDVVVTQASPMLNESANSDIGRASSAEPKDQVSFYSYSLKHNYRCSFFRQPKVEPTFDSSLNPLSCAFASSSSSFHNSQFGFGNNLCHFLYTGS